MTAPVFHDHYLRADTEAELLAALSAAGLAVEQRDIVGYEWGNDIHPEPPPETIVQVEVEGELVDQVQQEPFETLYGDPYLVPVLASFTHALDLVGTIHTPNGTTTDELGNEVPAFAAVPGVHANLRLVGDTPLHEALAPFEIPAPATPHRVWF